MQIITTNLEKAAAKIGLKISQEKTKVTVIQQRVSDRTSGEIKVEGKTVETVDKFKYLGSVISANGNAVDDINIKIGKTAPNLKKMNKIWSSTTISTRLEIRLYHAIILLCLLYPSETWRITVELAKKLNAFHQRCLRRILKISYIDHVTNDETLRKTQKDTLIKMIATQRLKLAGHIICMEDNRCAKTALSWVPSNGKRKRGRPRITWRRTFKNDLEQAGTTWDKQQHWLRIEMHGNCLLTGSSDRLEDLSLSKYQRRSS